MSWQRMARIRPWLVLLLGAAGLAVVTNTAMLERIYNGAEALQSHKENPSTSVVPTAYRGISPGDPAPDFEGRTVDGGTFRLADHRGKDTVLLNFFITQCAPCRWEMPLLSRYYDQHKDNGLVVVGVNLSTYGPDIHEFIKTEQVTFPVLDKPYDLARRLKVNSYPITVVVGPDGRIIARREGRIESESEIEAWHAAGRAQKGST